MFKHAFSAYLISVIATIILVNIFKEFKVFVAIGSSGIAAAVIFYWVANIKKHIPEKRELKLFHLTYSLLIFSTFFALIFFAESKNTPGIITMIIMAATYSGFMAIIFNEKMLNRELNK